MRAVLESTGFLFYLGGIWALFLYHGLNGIRLILIDSSRAAYYPRVLFWTLLGIGLIIFFSGLALY